MRQPNPKFTVPDHLDADALFVEDLMRKRYRRWKDRPYGGIESELSRWAFVVEGFVRPRTSYLLDVEYEHYLAGRRILAEMLQAAEQRNLVELLHWALPLTDELDDVFREHSYPDTENLVSCKGRLVPAYWFTRRIAKHPGLLEAYRDLDPPTKKTEIDHRPDFRPKPNDQTSN